MNPQNANQEILLFTGTSFANRELCGRDDESKEGQFISTHEKLEKACWDGLLDEMLPEVTDDANAEGESFIWQIISADNFLCINRGSCDENVNSELSIDPYYFITSLPLN